MRAHRQDLRCELSVYRLTESGEEALLLQHGQLQLTPPNPMQVTAKAAHEVGFRYTPCILQQALQRVALNVATGLLDAEEMLRANRFFQLRDAQRYILSHGVLRLTLANLVDVSSTQIQYAKTDYGKPVLNHAPVWVGFNLSHSGDYFAIVTSPLEVGVDIEVIRNVRDVEGIAKRVFTQDEQALIDAVSTEEKMGQFFRLWVRKEAVLKAAGAGLSLAAYAHSEGHNATLAIPGESRKNFVLWSSVIERNLAVAVAMGKP